MEHTTDLAPAIQKLLDAGATGADVKGRVLDITCTDGDRSLVVPVAFVPAKDGGMTAVPLLDVVQRGADIARTLRLRDAAGPDRREGMAHHQSLDSFVWHANRFKASNSAVWADEEKRKLVSVLDYHEAGATGAPRWGKHRGTYECPLSEAWKAWGGGEPLEFDQEEFALHLDGRDRELVAGLLPDGRTAPTPAALVTLANNLESYADAKAKRVRDQQTGRLTLAYSTETGFVGDIAPPSSFLVRVPVFQDGAPQDLEVRLRVDVSREGVAKFTVQIHAAGDVLRDAFRGLCDRVRAGCDDIPVFVGTPE